MSQDHRMGHRERLRERFLKKGGAVNLHDYEILEMLLFAAKPRGDVKPLAKDLLKQFGSLKDVLQASPEKLSTIKGMGPSSIVSIKVAHEAAARMLFLEAQSQPILNSAQKVIEYCKVRMAGLETEQFRLIFLDRKNQIISDELHQEGTIDNIPIFPREVVKRALSLGAGAMILVHNHPTGDPTPSQSDIDLTLKMIKIASPLDIKIHDHIIVGRYGYSSLKERGLM